MEKPKFSKTAFQKWRYCANTHSDYQGQSKWNDLTMVVCSAAFEIQLNGSIVSPM